MFKFNFNYLLKYIYNTYVYIRQVYIYRKQRVHAEKVAKRVWHINSLYIISDSSIYKLYVEGYKAERGALLYLYITNILAYIIHRKFIGNEEICFKNFRKFRNLLLIDCMCLCMYVFCGG